MQTDSLFRRAARLRALVAQRGGLLGALRTSAAILRREGLRGLRARLGAAQPDLTVYPDAESHRLAAARPALLLSDAHIRLIRALRDPAIPQASASLGLSLAVHDAAAALPAFLAALSGQSFPLSRLNVAVVDCGSADGTRAMLEGYARDHGSRYASFAILARGGSDLHQGHDQAIRQLSDAFVLVADVGTALGADTIVRAAKAALADDEGVAAWGFGPAEGDPLTQEALSLGPTGFVIRRAAYLAAGSGSDLRAAGWRLRALPQIAAAVPRPAPTVTIITRTHGPAAILREAIASVLNQTYPAIEHLIVEDRTDFAADTVREVARAYGTDIRYLKSAGPGRAAAGNVGLAHARGEFVLFLDNDDLLFADHVALLVEALQARPDLAGAYALAWEVQTEADERGHYREVMQLLPASQWLDFDRQRLETVNFIPIQSLLFRRSLYQRAGGFREDLDHLEDWNLWWRYAQQGDFQLLRRISSLYRTPADPQRRAQRQADLDAAYARVRRLNREAAGPPP